MRLPLSTSLKTRTGAPEGKDARLKNAYVEVRGEQSVVRKRPQAQGGVAVGSGTAQGGIGLVINGTPSFIGFWGDTLTNYTGGGTTWAVGTSYSIGDHISYNFVDYWALTDHSGSTPPSANWSRSYVPAVPRIYATWNPADCSIYTILSNGNLTATQVNYLGTGVRSTIGKSSGKWYWECTVIYCDAGQTLGIFIGVATFSSNISSFVGFDSNGWSYHENSTEFGTPYKWNSGVSTSYGTVFTVGDVIGVALDMDAGTLEFYKNGVSQGVAFTGITGTIFAALAMAGLSPINPTKVTANFGASAFAYSVPSGYNSGLYT